MTTVLASLPFVRVLTSPRAYDEQQPQPLRRMILAGLLDAAIRGKTVAALWLRPEPGEPLQVLIARDRLAPVVAATATQSAGQPLLFPLGATGSTLPAADLEKLLAPFTYWTACTGAFEPLLRDVEEQTGRTEQRWMSSPLDELVGYLSHEAFAWLVVGIPARDADTRAELDQVRRELFRLRQSGRLSESDVIGLEQQQAWFRELSRAGPGGVWDLAIAVGTPYEFAQLPLASMLCAAAEHSVSQYKFRPVNDATFTSPDQAIATRSPDDRGSRGHAFRATADLAAALIRPPELEIPGVRAVTPPSFDVTIEENADPEDAIELGTVLDRHLRPVGAVRIPIGSLNRHTFVCGATGGGKSQTVRALLESLSRQVPHVPWLVIEPAKAEYARMAGRLADLPDLDVLVITPGDRDSPPASINPLEPASLEPGNPTRTFPLQSHADLVRALFLAAFQAEEPFPQVLSYALTECYEQAGWDLVTGEPLTSWDRETGQPIQGQHDRSLPRYPTLADVQRSARAVVEAVGYAEDVKRNVRGFVEVRIGSLRTGTPGRLFEGGHPLDFAELLQRNVVIEAEGITNDQDKAFVMGALLIRLYEQLLLEEKERYAREGTPMRLRHVTVIEEAHRLLRNVPEDSPAAHSVELFASLLAEVRAYGEGIVIAEQIPSKIIPDVIKNTALKIVHRLPAADDRAALGATMNLSEEQSEYIVTLRPGAAAIFVDGMDRPLLAAMPIGEEREDARSGDRIPPLHPQRRRSRACAAECVTSRPCSLLTMRHADRWLTKHPEVTFWMEIAFAAHGIGFPAPGLADTHSVRELRRDAVDDPALVQCAIAHAAENAIGARYVGMKDFYDPESLAEHLAETLWAILSDRDSELCTDDRGRWRVGRQRYADIEAALETSSGQDEGADRARVHDEILRRALERGLNLQHETPSSWLTHVRSLPWLHYRDNRQRALLVGSEAPPRVLQAAASIAGPGRPSEQLRAASDRVLFWRNPNHPEVLIPHLHAQTTEGS